MTTLIEEVPVDDLIILESHKGGSVVVSKYQYVLAESVDVIQLLPVDDEREIRTFYKPYWKVVKQ